MLVPPSLKYNGSGLASHPMVCIACVARERVERIAVPGATTSGLVLPFWTGPRPLNAAMPSGLSATASLPIRSGGNSSPAPYVSPLSKPGRSFSVAPTVMQFLAVPGGVHEPGSMRPVPLESVRLVSRGEANHAITMVPDEIFDFR